MFEWWYLFLFSGAVFANISATFLISCEVQTRYSRISKYSEQYIWDHLPGAKVRIWIGSEYDAVFYFSFTASCNLTKTFTFFSMSFLSQESDSKLFKQSTCTFYTSEILLFKVFINACQLAGETPIDWTFFLGVWHLVNSLSLSLTDWNLSSSSIHLVYL